MSKKGPRSAAFNLLTESLSEEIVSHYLELAYYVREQELARRREMERGKMAVRRAKAAALAAAMEVAARAAGIPLRDRGGKGKGQRKSGRRPRSKGRTWLKGKGRPEDQLRAELSTTEPESQAALGPHPAPRVTEVDAGSGRPADELAAAVLPEPAPKAGPSKSRNRKPITREDILKLVVADSLGYLGKVRADGWGGLTCAESGRVGGMMTRRMKRLEKGFPVPELPPAPEAP